MISTDVQRSDSDHWSTGEEMVAIRIHWNANQTERIDLTVPQARELAGQLARHLGLDDDAVDRAVMAMRAEGIGLSRAHRVAASIRELSR